MKDANLGRVLVLPSVLTILLLTLFPLLYSLTLSFHSWQLPNPSPRFVGLENYAHLGRDLRFHLALLRSIGFVAVTVSLQFFLGMSGAVLLDRNLRSLGTMTSVLIVPIMIAPVAVGAIWMPLYDINFGLLNYCLSLLGVGKMEWLATQANALPSLMIIDLWQWTPFMLLIFLAGLQSIPREPIEAARIGGASEWRIFRSICLPMMRRVIAIAILLRGVDSFGKFFDTAYLLTGGGPGTASETLNLYIYQVGFKFFRMGYASALSFSMLLIAMVGILLFYRFFRVE